MGGHSPEEIQKETRRYIVVFAALAALTVVTVAVSYLDLNMAAAVTVALTVAVIKGTLVAGYFMHLFDEKKTVYAILILTVFFFAMVFLLPAGSFWDQVEVQ